MIWVLRLLGALLTSARSSRAAREAGIRAGYEKLLSTRRPIFEHITFSNDMRGRTYFRLIMPLSEGGLDVSTIWAVTHYYQGSWQPIRD